MLKLPTKLKNPWMLFQLKIHPQLLLLSLFKVCLLSMITLLPYSKSFTCRINKNFFPWHSRPSATSSNVPFQLCAPSTKLGLCHYILPLHLSFYWSCALCLECPSPSAPLWGFCPPSLFTCNAASQFSFPPLKSVWCCKEKHASKFVTPVSHPASPLCSYGNWGKLLGFS